MRYYIISGEASGDLHGSNLVKALKQQDAQAQIRCWGGDMMQAAGAEVVKHYRELSFMGFAEVVKNLPAILRNFRFAKEDIKAFQPDVLILVDYPGFNIRMAKWARSHQIKVVYYISPQVWAWKQGRVKTIREVVDKMLVILPFEKPFYQNWNYDVTYVGHPLVEVVEQELDKPGMDLILLDGRIPGQKPIIALLPGSREQEIRVKLPLMLEASKHFPHYHFIVAQAPAQPAELYSEMAAPYSNVSVAITGQTYPLLRTAKAALVTSGTATLETALFGLPQVVCYKGSWLSYQVAKRVVKVQYISLVNLIMAKPVVKELIQNELTADNIRHELDLILHDEAVIGRMKEDYRQLKNLLRQNEPASAKAAAEIINFIKK